jgi:transposase
MTERIWVGLDVHAATISIATVAAGTAEPRVWEIPNDPKEIRRTFKRLGQGTELHCCYEAGVCGFEVRRLLEAMGIQCEVVAPALVPRRPGDRVKTDRRDALKLARLHRAGELCAIAVPTPEQEAVRDVVRAREDVRRDLTAARHRIATFLLRHGRIYSETNWTKRHWAWVRGQVFERDAERITFEHYLALVTYLETRRASLDREIELVAETDAYRAQVEKLCTLRGFSVLGSMVLLSEVVDFRRFQTPRELMAYVGLVPSERSSGAKEKRGGITKAGNAHVRRILVEAAWAYRHRPALSKRAKRILTAQPAAVATVAVKAQQRLHRRYMRLVGRGKKSQLAAVAVARELCGFTWALMTA